MPFGLWIALCILISEWCFIFRFFDLSNVRSASKNESKNGYFRSWAVHKHKFWVKWWNMTAFIISNNFCWFLNCQSSEKWKNVKKWGIFDTLVTLLRLKNRKIKHHSEIRMQRAIYKPNGIGIGDYPGHPIIVLIVDWKVFSLVVIFLGLTRKKSDRTA